MPVATPCGGRLFLKPAHCLHTHCLHTHCLFTLFLLTWPLFSAGYVPRGGYRLKYEASGGSTHLQACPPFCGAPLNFNTIVNPS
jgi:hypothetical protein